MGFLMDALCSKQKKISAHNSKMECVRTKKELRRKSENNKKRDL